MQVIAMRFCPSRDGNDSPGSSYQETRVRALPTPGRVVRSGGQEYSAMRLPSALANMSPSASPAAMTTCPSIRLASSYRVLPILTTPYG